MPARLLPNSLLVRVGLPIGGGALIGAVSVVLLSGRSPLLLAMVVCGGAVLIPSIVVRDRMAYWLCLFLLTLPFDVNKHFLEPERALTLVDTIGGPWGPIAPSVHLIDLALLPLLGLWLVRKIRSRESIRFPRVALLPLAFLLYTAVTTIAAPLPYFAVLAWLKQLKYFVIFLFAADAIDVRVYGKVILSVLLATLLLQGTVTIARYKLQYFDPVFGETLGRTTKEVRGEAEGTRRVAADDSNGLERGFGTFYHANVTAMHLEMLLPFALALALGVRSRRWRSTYGLVFAVGAMGHYVTFSRAGLVAFLVSTGICVAVASLRGLLPRRILAPLFGVGALVVLLMVPFVLSHMQMRPSEARFHMDHLRHGAAIALSHPIFGVGLNNSSFVRPYVVTEGMMYGGHLLPIHSHHLLGLAETGVIGYALYMVFFVLVGVQAFRRSASENLYVRTFSIGVLGSFAAICLHVTTDYLGFEASHVMLWFYAGLVVAQANRRPQAEGETERSHTSWAGASTDGRH